MFFNPNTPLEDMEPEKYKKDPIKNENHDFLLQLTLLFLENCYEFSEAWSLLTVHEFCVNIEQHGFLKGFIKLQLSRWCMCEEREEMSWWVSDDTRKTNSDQKMSHQANKHWKVLHTLTLEKISYRWNNWLLNFGAGMEMFAHMGSRTLHTC